LRVQGKPDNLGTPSQAGATEPSVDKKIDTAPFPGSDAVGKRRRGRKPRVMQDLDPEATKQRLTDVRTMAASGYSNRQIAQKHDVSERQVGRWLRWPEELPS
jgi:DNA-binding NarL/FixJ family response regulator